MSIMGRFFIAGKFNIPEQKVLCVSTASVFVAKQVALERHPAIFRFHFQPHPPASKLVQKNTENQVSMNNETAAGDERFNSRRNNKRKKNKGFCVNGNKCGRRRKRPVRELKRYRRN